MKPHRLAACAVGITLTLMPPLQAFAQHSPLLKPKPIPSDMRPHVRESQCGVYVGFYGPMDYRTADPLDRRVVEEYHFDMEMRTFLAGQVEGRNRAGTGPVGGGFQYTLNAFPNHPAALSLMEQLGRKFKSEEVPGSAIPIECWFVRAFKLVPDDPAVRVMYGIYLANRNRAAEAVYQLDKADEAVRDIRALQYHQALGYLAAKEYEKAQMAALRARRAGYPLDYVLRQVKDSGRWSSAVEEKFKAEVAVEVAAAAAEAASDAAASAAASGTAASGTAASTRPGATPAASAPASVGAGPAQSAPASAAPASAATPAGRS